MIAAPTVSNWFSGILVGWPGGGADHVEVHVCDDIHFDPGEDTYCGTLWDPGEWSMFDTRRGCTYYARLVALNIDGDVLEVSPVSRGIEPLFLVSRG